MNANQHRNRRSKYDHDKPKYADRDAEGVHPEGSSAYRFIRRNNVRFSERRDEPATTRIKRKDAISHQNEAVRSIPAP